MSRTRNSPLPPFEANEPSETLPSPTETPPSPMETPENPLNEPIPPQAPPRRRGRPPKAEAAGSDAPLTAADCEPIHDLLGALLGLLDGTTQLDSPIGALTAEEKKRLNERGVAVWRDILPTSKFARRLFYVAAILVCIVPRVVRRVFAKSSLPKPPVASSARTMVPPVERAQPQPEAAAQLEVPHIPVPQMQGW